MASKKPFDQKQFIKLCKLHCTLLEIADFFDVSDDTIKRRCHEIWGQSFELCWNRFSSGGRRSIRQKQFTEAMNGNTKMLTWLGTNWLGQSDQPVRVEDKDSEIPAPVYEIRKIG